MDIFSIISYFITTFIGSFFGWLFTRRKYNTEVDGAKIENFDKALDAYKKMYEDMIGDLKQENNELRTEVADLKSELAENRKQIITLTNFVLASAIKRADGDTDSLEAIREIIK